jgi:hypothetical protein
MLSNASATMALYDVEVLNSLGNGVQSSGSLVIERSRLSGHGGAGVYSGSGNGSHLYLNRSVLTQNGAEGVRVDAYDATVFSNIIANNGAAVGAYGMRVGVARPDQTRIEFNTVVGNAGGGIFCGTGASLRNSVIVNNQGASQVSGCTVTYSSIQGAAPDVATGITNVVPTFVDAAAGDFHLAPGSPVARLADPVTDYSPPLSADLDGAPRPSPTATRADLGADEIDD